ncbi:uncharacterized protein LOC106941426, partial [Poecilia latipinna]|uniref:uncharacterized protein LOC106941426 n=1 Tax=Poecilia latipinna TaxID=48699 RepID=UPI00072E4150
MSNIPIVIIGSKNPEYASQIPKISKKWQKRTQGLPCPWPENGSFDLSLCEQMETRIADYKAKNKGKKRQAKRELELNILQLFKEEGEKYRKNLKQQLAELKNNYEKPDDDQMNPAGLYPALTGVLNITGDFGYRNDDQIRDIKQGKDNELEIQLDRSSTGHTPRSPVAQTPAPPRGPPQTSTGATDSSTNNKHSKSMELPTSYANADGYKPAGRYDTSLPPVQTRSQTSGAGCSTTRTVGNIKILDCYAGSNNNKFFDGYAGHLKRRRSGDAYWLRLGPEVLNIERKANQTQIQDIEEEIDEGLRQLAEKEPGCDNGEDGAMAGPSTSTPVKEQKAPNQKEYDLRSRPDIRKPDRYDPSKQLPIILKGDIAQYLPFASMDLVGLVSRLPDIHNGAGRWIRALEEETVGKILALGDIKAILAKVVGIPTMQNILKDHPWMLQERADGIELNACRTMIWAALRAEFPNKVDPKNMKAEPIGDSENPASYVARQLRRWNEVMEFDVDEYPMIAGVLRKSLVDVMPEPVRTKLEEVVALMSIPHKEFRDHVEDSKKALHGLTGDEAVRPEHPEHAGHVVVLDIVLTSAEMVTTHSKDGRVAEPDQVHRQPHTITKQFHTINRELHTILKESHMIHQFNKIHQLNTIHQILDTRDAQRTLGER